MTPVQRGLKHLFIPLTGDHQRKELQRGSGDDLLAAVDGPPCEHCGCRRILDFKLAGVRCRGCGRDRVLPTPPEPQEIDVP